MLIKSFAVWSGATRSIVVIIPRPSTIVVISPVIIPRPSTIVVIIPRPSTIVVISPVIIPRPSTIVVISPVIIPRPSTIVVIIPRCPTIVVISPVIIPRPSTIVAIIPRCPTIVVISPVPIVSVTTPIVVISPVPIVSVTTPIVAIPSIVIVSPVKVIVRPISPSVVVRPTRGPSALPRVPPPHVVRSLARTLRPARNTMMSYPTNRLGRAPRTTQQQASLRGALPRLLRPPPLPRAPPAQTRRMQNFEAARASQFVPRSQHAA
jgi:hypothetical protein